MAYWIFSTLDICYSWFVNSKNVDFINFKKNLIRKTSRLFVNMKTYHVSANLNFIKLGLIWPVSDRSKRNTFHNVRKNVWNLNIQCKINRNTDFGRWSFPMMRTSSLPYFHQIKIFNKKRPPWCSLFFLLSFNLKF